jgi:GNAT superfamily N-acetyltransferase
VASPVEIRGATPNDVERIFAWIVELATYERAPEQVTGSEELLAEALFGPHPSAEALVAELDGAAAGFALFHTTFSTWECRAGIWLEDLYVPPERRRHGVGVALIRRLAQITVERGGVRLEWVVLDWNIPAIALYERLGGKILSDWRIYRLDRSALSEFASGVEEPAR